MSLTSHKSLKITKIVYCCGKCNNILGNDFYCKSCKHQFLGDVKIE